MAAALAVVLVIFGICLFVAAAVQRVPQEDLLTPVSGRLKSVTAQQIRLADATYRFAPYVHWTKKEAGALSDAVEPGGEVLLCLDEQSRVVSLSAGDRDFLRYDTVVNRSAFRQIFRVCLGLALVIVSVVILTVGKIGPFKMRKTAAPR